MLRGAVARPLWEVCVRVCEVDGGRPMWLHAAGFPPCHCCRCCTVTSLSVLVTLAFPLWTFSVNPLV